MLKHRSGCGYWNLYTPDVGLKRDYFSVADYKAKAWYDGSRIIKFD
jgi:hypothetical protein